MNKLLYMSMGVLVGGALAFTSINASKIKNKIQENKENILSELDEKMDEFSFLIEKIDEEKLKKKLISKYNYLLRKIQRANYFPLKSDLKEMIDAAISEIKKLTASKLKKET